jgi:hypothetical protein
MFSIQKLTYLVITKENGVDAKAMVVIEDSVLGGGVDKKAAPVVAAGIERVEVRSFLLDVFFV